MKNTWLRCVLVLVFIPLLPVVSGQQLRQKQQPCTFPESEVEPFFFDINADTPVDSIIVDTVVDPPNAQLDVINVRSNNLPAVDFTGKFRIEQRASGQFMVINRDNLNLPDYPSYINETYLYMTVACNSKAYPLITIRVRNFNSHPPKFYNIPYDVKLPEKASVNSVVNTAVLALDRDPSPAYSVSYAIESGQSGEEFAIVPSTTEFHKLRSIPNHFKAKSKWRPEQLPPIIKLRVQHQPRHKEYNLNISATDNGNPPRKTYTNLRITVNQPDEKKYLKFSQPEYFANYSKLMSVDTEIVPHTAMIAELTDNAPQHLRRRSRIMYELIDSDYSDSFLLDPRTAQLTIRKKLTNDLPNMFTLKIKGYLEAEPSIEETTTLSLADIADTSLTYFTKCFHEISVQENAYPNTRVLSLSAHGEPDDFELVNGTDYFRINSLGEVSVKAPFDREKQDLYVFQAKVIEKDRTYPEGSGLCRVCTIVVKIEDVNDHTPKFDKTNYIFYTEEQPYNNTEIGTIRALDADKGQFGKVHYRILTDDVGYVPFVLFEADGAATIYYNTRDKDYYPEGMYTFPVEAYDNKDNPRSARVNVQVQLHPAPENEDYDVDEKPRRPAQVFAAPRLAVDALDEETEESIDAVPVVVEKEQVIPKSFFKSEKTVSKKAPPKTIIRPMSELNKPTKEKFEFDTYKFLLYGQVQEQQYVGTIRTLNSSSDAVTYELEPGIRGFFKIDPKNGHITVDNRLLDDEYEEVRFTALAKRGNRIAANTLITVILDDSVSIYELTPRFEQSFYRFEVEENESSEAIGSVQAHHRAVEIDNDRIIYALRPSKDAESFSIDQETGGITNNVAFDRETKHLYTFGILGCLESNSSSCEETQAVIVVLDVNDNAPQFVGAPYKVTISDDIEPETEILTLEATDADLEKNAQIKFELVSNGRGNFKVDESSGDLIYTGKEPLHANRRFSLKVRAVDGGAPTRSSETTITINVGGDNLNPTAPQFKNFRYEVQLPAIVPPNTKIVTVEASDPDEGVEGQIIYKIRNDSDPRQSRILQLFKIDEDTGELWSRQTINGEIDGPHIQLVVEAHDQSVVFPRKAETVVMINFEAIKVPKLEFVPLPKTVFISNEKLVGSEIISIAARTANENDKHKIRYSITQPAHADYFSVPTNTGSLLVKKKLVPGRFPITLVAYFPGSNLNATHKMMIVVMTDRDKYPVFEKLGYEMNVPISAAFPVKLDPLNATLSTGRIEYSLYQPEKLPKGISVDKMTGQLTIFDDFVSAFDGTNNIFVVIRARNIDWPSFYSDVGVSLVLSDTSTALSFKAKLYRYVIAENKQQGTTLDPAVEVQNAAEIGNVQYFVEPKDSIFAINNDGYLYLKKTVDLEEFPQTSQGIVDVTIVAVRGSDRATTKAQIKVDDVNEFVPLFLQEQYTIETRHQPLPHEIIGKITAIDEDFTDRGKLKYEILANSGEASEMVTIQSNGSIAALPNVKFENGIYDMIVQATDHVGHTAEVVVTLYVEIESASSPEVKQLDENWQLTDDQLVGSKFALFGLPDAKWQFTIADGNDDGMFRINQINDTMAEVEIVAEPKNTEATTRKLAVEIVNVAKQESMMENIHVDLSQPISKKVPHFVGEAEDRQVKLASDFNPNAIIITAKAMQQEGNDRITYQIMENPDGMFELNPNTGEISFARNNKPKYPGIYQTKIKAVATNPRTKTQYSSDEMFTIQIMPIGSAEIPVMIPNVPPTAANSGEHQGSAHVSSPELSPTSSAPSTTTTGARTSTQTGSTPTTTRVNAPTTTEITATTTQPTAVNPLPLAFEQPEYSFIVDSPRRGVKVGDLQIIDDHQSGAALKFDIRPREMSQNFRVDEETREVFIAKVPEGSGQVQEFVFNVTAVDANDPSRRGQTEVFVTFIPDAVDFPDPTDLSATGDLATPASTSTSTLASTPRPSTNEDVLPSAKPINPAGNPPQGLTEDDVHFATSEFKAMLPEGKYGNGGSIVTLKPFPLSEGMPEGVRYHIESFNTNNESLFFSIKEDTGELIVFGQIDRETNNVYEFIVTATSYLFDPPVQDSALVEIQVLDVNDNIPAFVNSPHAAALSTNAPIGSVIANFAVNDPDEGPAGQVSFSLEGEHSDHFNIDSAGTLTVSMPLTDLPDNIALTVVANDGGRPSSRSAHLMEIQMYAQSATEPQFKELEYSALLSADAKRADFVAHIVAGIGSFEYSFDDTFSDLFVVDNNGLVSLGRTPIFSETNKYYTLNLTATDAKNQSSSTLLTVFLEAPAASSSAPGTTPASTLTPTTTDNGEMYCQFDPKVYETTIAENTNGRQRLAQVHADCHNLPSESHVVYYIHQGADDFEMNETSGELFVNGPLDRENRTLHFVVINVSVITPDGKEQEVRKIRQSNPIVEYAKSKLLDNQALVVIRVIDVNDHVPSFTRVNSKGEYVFVVDWQTHPPQSIGRIQAVDEDEKPVVTYSFSAPVEYFVINATSGVVTLVKSFEFTDETVFDVEVIASDGERQQTTKMKVYPLVPGTNVIIVAANNREEEIDELAVSRELTQALETDVRILGKQAFVDGNNRVDQAKAHLLVYGLRKETHEPIPAEELKNMLDKIRPELDASPNLKISAITLPAVSSRIQMSNWEIILLVVALVLLVTACLTCILLLRCFKRRSMLAKSDAEYMVDAESNGPRPYNVELISRRTAQTMLASRELPNPFEDVKLSQPASTEIPALPASKPPNVSITASST